MTADPHRFYKYLAANDAGVTNGVAHCDPLCFYVTERGSHPVEADTTGRELCYACVNRTFRFWAEHSSAHFMEAVRFHDDN